MPSTLIVIETSAGELRESCLELVTAAVSANPGQPVTALVVGHGVTPVGEQVARTSVDLTLVADDPALERYTLDVYTAVVEAAVAKTSPSLVLFSGTTTGRDLGPYLAARTGKDCLSDCTEVRLNGKSLAGVRPVYQGKMLADVEIPVDEIAFAVVRSGAYPPPQPGSATNVEPFDGSLAGIDQRTKLVDVTAPPVGDVNLDDAEIVVVGGRGVGSAENFAILEELASALNAPVGATRAVTDLGWRPHYEQIGQTGKTIRPRLYIGAGVSGAVQHTVGMRGSETIVAINRDRSAPLLRLADISVIGDLNEIVPALTGAIREATTT